MKKIGLGKEFLVAFLWRKIMSVGNDKIDQGHRHLICYINTIELVLQNPKEKDLIIEALEQLQTTTVKNFRAEEAIQRKIGYPHTLHHRREHEKLLRQLNDVIKKIDYCRNPDEITNCAPDLVIFLRNWIVDHVLHEDMLVRPFLARYPKAYS